MPLSVASGQTGCTQPWKCQLWMARWGPNLKSSWGNQATSSQMDLLAPSVVHYVATGWSTAKSVASPTWFSPSIAPSWNRKPLLSSSSSRTRRDHTLKNALSSSAGVPGSCWFCCTSSGSSCSSNDPLNQGCRDSRGRPAGVFIRGAARNYGDVLLLRSHPEWINHSGLLHRSEIESETKKC